ncbi:MAG: transcriptional repressor [Syntrophorhabdaceae bacterium]|nr:transcriptional repressor [Syntrophorhabdaceae bacterium]
MILSDITDIKQTPQRLAIIEYLELNRVHPSALDVYKAVSEKFPTMSFATVYNTLEKLKEKRLIIELSIDTGKKRFDCDTRPHHHLICVKCREIFDVFTEFILELPEDEFQGFDIIGNHVDFYGICKKCKDIEGLGSEQNKD